MVSTEMMQLILDELKGIKQDVSELKTGQAKLEESVSKIEDRTLRIEDRTLRIEERTLRIEDRTLRIEVTLENDIAQKLGALFDGHQLNTEKLDHISMVVDDLDASVAAMDVVTHFNTNEIIKLKIVK